MPWRVYRPGDRRRPLADRRDGQDRRPVLLLQGDPAAARRCVPPWMPVVGLEGGKINIVPVDFVAAAMDHIAHQDGLDGQAFHLTDPNPKSAGQVINVVRARRARARVRDADRPPDDERRAEAGARDDRPAAAGAGASPTRCWATSGSRARCSPTSTTRATTTPATRSARSRARASQVPALEALRRPAVGLLGAQPRPRPVQGPQPARRDRGQGRRDHRRVERHRQGARAEGRRGRRHRGAGRALGGQARGDRRRRSRSRAARPPCTRPTSPTSRTCDRLVAEILAEHGRVDILVNNAGRSIRRSIENSYDRFHDFQRTMQLNYFGALKLILGFLPGMRERKSGHIINVSSIGAQTNTPRFSAYVASKSALDAFSRSIASEIVDDEREHHDRLHAARAHADDRADRDLRRVPDRLARRGGRHDHAGHDLPAEEDRDAARHLRRGAVRARAEVGRRDPEHGVQALPRELGGEGREARRTRRSRPRASRSRT